MSVIRAQRDQNIAKLQRLLSAPNVENGETFTFYADHGRYRFSVKVEIHPAFSRYIFSQYDRTQRGEPLVDTWYCRDFKCIREELSAQFLDIYVPYDI